jgi:hypothetical protein
MQPIVFRQSNDMPLFLAGFLFKETPHTVKISLSPKETTGRFYYKPLWILRVKDYEEAKEYARRYTEKAKQAVRREQQALDIARDNLAEMRRDYDRRLYAVTHAIPGMKLFRKGAPSDDC